MDINKLNNTLDKLMISSQDYSNINTNPTPNNRSRRPSLENINRYRRPSIDANTNIPTTTITNSPNLKNIDNFQSNNTNNKYVDNYYINKNVGSSKRSPDFHYMNMNNNSDNYIKDSNNRNIYTSSYNQNYPISRKASSSSSGSLNEIYYNNINNNNTIQGQNTNNNNRKNNRNLEHLRIKTHTRNISNSSDSYNQQQQQYQQMQSYSPNIGYATASLQAPIPPSANYNFERRGSQDTMGSSRFSPTESSSCSNRDSTFSSTSQGHVYDDPPQTASVISDVASVTLQSLSVDLVSGYLSRISTSGFIKSTKRNFYVLDTAGLYYFKTNDPFARAKGCIRFDKNTKLHDIKESSKEKESKIIEIDVIKSNKLHLVQLQAEDPEDRNMWHRAIKKIIVRQKYVNEALPPLPPLPPNLSQPSSQQQQQLPNSIKSNQFSSSTTNLNQKAAYSQYSTKSQQQLYLNKQKLYQQQQQQPQFYNVNIPNESNSYSNTKLGGWISPDISNPEFIPNENPYSSNASNYSNKNSKSLDEINNPLIIAANYKRRPSFDVQMIHSRNNSHSSTKEYNYPQRYSNEQNY